MKRHEIISAHYTEICDKMTELYRSVVESDGRIQYALYIWEDGELETLCDVQGSNSWLKAKDTEPRRLYYVTTVSVDPGFDPWDYAEDGAPDDETEREALLAEIVDYLVSDYHGSVRDRLDAVIDDASQEL